MKICPRCHQPIIPEVFLPPIKARIFDIVKNHPGVTAQEITAKLKSTTNTDTIRQHISQINKKIAATGFHIGCGYGSGEKGLYRIMKIEKEKS